MGVDCMAWVQFVQTIRIQLDRDLYNNLLQCSDSEWHVTVTVLIVCELISFN